ncbi:MAG: hypothetical protein AB7P03_17450 [Kofleriaceae bacterium]
MPLDLIVRREYDPAALLAKHPPKLKHPHKRLVFELACPPHATHRGPVTVTRWRAAALPANLELARVELIVSRGYYDYRDSGPGTWHVNFADPQLFVAYGSSLLAQDELQAAEHPVLGSVREALLAEKLPAQTEENLEPTPVLVANVERRCEIATAPDLDAGRPYGLYGNRFASATAEVVRKAIRLVDPPTISNLIAIAAPGGGRGAYFRRDLDRILLTAYTGFLAAVSESHRSSPGTTVEIRTGFWGCGAFGGNRHAMTLLQLLAARLAGIARLRFYAFDDNGEADVRAGVADLERVPGAGRVGESLDDLMERIADLDYEWGISDGN